MRWFVLLAALAGCDRLLKLDDITPHGDGGGGGDATARPDSTRRPCPLDGSTPTFTGSPRLVTPGCSTYTVGGPAWVGYGDGNLATAECGGTIKAGLEGGPLDHTEMGLSGTNPHQFGLAQMFMVSVANVTSYLRAPTADAWTNPVAETFNSLTMDDVIGSASMTALRHDIAFRPGSSPVLLEYVETAAHQWTIQSQIMVANVEPLGPPNLSSDGLRLVFSAYDGTAVNVYFLARGTLSSAFPTTAQLLFSTSGNATTPFMTDDCQTLYFTDQNGDVNAVDP